jgi:hypothetical protein
MSHARRKLRVPDQVKGLLKRNNQPQAMWYVGTLQAENGRDVRVKAAGPVDDAPAKPLPVRRSGEHPDRALRED